MTDSIDAAIAEAFADGSEASQSTLQMPSQPSSPLNSPVQRRGGPKGKGWFCTFPYTPDVHERMPKLKDLLFQEGIRIPVKYWAYSEERGEPTAEKPEGYHHIHCIVVFQEQTTMGKNNLKKMQRALSEDANANVQKQIGNIEVRRYAWAQLALMLGTVSRGLPVPTVYKFSGPNDTLPRKKP